MIIAEYRAIFAHEFGPELAVAAKANPTFHVTFHGNVDVFILNATILQFLYRITHHNLWAADHCYGMQWIKLHFWYECGNDSDITAPIPSGAVDSNLNIKVKTSTPAFQFFFVK